MVKLLELFAGTQSVGKVAKEMGYDVVSVDLCKKYKPDI
jgi:adenine-specific DNA methylase